MKKSNLLLIVTLAVLLVSLSVYNVALTAEYRKGNYKDLFYGFKSIAIKDFQAIDVNAASNLDVRIIQGEFRIWIEERSTEFIKFKKTGNRLQIDAVFPERERNFERVIITCPRISEISTNAFFFVNGKKELKTRDYQVSPVKVEGFTLDSLLLKQDNTSGIRLSGNKIGKLRSLTGISPGAVSKLEIGPDNTIREADLTVRNRARLIVNTSKIARLRYDFGDSTEVTFTGAATSLFRK